MEYLAIKHKKESMLFIQERRERETYINNCCKRNWEVNTIVVRSFNNLSNCLKYIDEINGVNECLKMVFNCKK